MENGDVMGNGKHHHGNGHHHHHHDGGGGGGGGNGAKKGWDDRLTVLNWLAIGLLAYISYATFPPGGLSGAGAGGAAAGGRATLLHVWYFGWITALSTGLGTLPFMVVAEMNKWWLGVSNGARSGLRVCLCTRVCFGGIQLCTRCACACACLCMDMYVRTYLPTFHQDRSIEPREDPRLTPPPPLSPPPL